MAAFGSSLPLQKFSPAASCISQHPNPLPFCSYGTTSNFVPPLQYERASPNGSSASTKISATSTHSTPTSHNSASNAALILQSQPSTLFSDVTSLANSLRKGAGLDASLLSYRETFVIRCYEVGMHRTASIESIANLLQEVACDHAQSVGFSTDGFATTPSMRKRHLIWVTTRMHIEVEQFPVWGDVIQIETWCQSEGKVGTRRDWLMTNAATGKRIGRATSTWVMMNEVTRRLSRITDDLRDELICYYPTAPRLAFPEQNSSSLKKIPKLEEPADHFLSGLMPRRGDLDMNQHVNNVTYIGWTLESMPQHIVSTHQLHSITLDYRRECTYGDIVESLASLESGDDQQLSSLPVTASKGAGINGVSVTSSNNASTGGGFEFQHLIRLTGSNIEINRGRSVWKRKPER